MTRLVCGATALWLAALAGCALNPVSRRPELAMVSQSTELEIGRQQAGAIDREMGLVADGPLVAYVRGVGERLAARSPRRDVPYAFHVVDAPEPNAFAVPGHVYVTRGLLVLLNDEDELAGVLGHEVGHIAARHAVQRLSRALPAGILTGLVSGVTGLASPLLGDLVQAGGDLATDALLAPYSREQEREADRVGQDIAAEAGWDPAALTRALATLERAEAFEPEAARRPSFLDSHPTTPERARNTAAHARELTPAPRVAIAATPEAFLARLDGMVCGVSAAHGVFEQTTFLHADLGFHLRFPEGWKTANTLTHVVGATADGASGAVLSVADAGDDPMIGVRAFEKSVQQTLGPRVERTTIDGRPAAHVSGTIESDGRRVAIDVWWVALGGQVFQLTGITSAASPTKRSVIEAVARSFGALTTEERGGIRELRLRIVPARAGDTVAAVALRSGTPWPVEYVAVVNGLERRGNLSAGRLVKTAVPEPYRP